MAANMIILWQRFSAGQSYFFPFWLECSSRSGWGGRRRPWASAGLWGKRYFSCSCCYLSASPFTFFSPLQLVNNGPSVVSRSRLEVKCLLRATGHRLLYPAEVVTEGPLSCSSKTTFNPLKLKVSTPNQTTWQLSSWLQWSMPLLLNAAPASSSKQPHICEVWARHPEEGGPKKPLSCSRKLGES